MFKCFRLRCLLNTCWWLNVTERKGVLEKKNAWVLLEVNTALLIPHDFSMKQIWVGRPIPFWPWKGIGGNSSGVKLLTFESCASPSQLSDRGLGGYLGEQWASKSQFPHWTRGVIAPNASHQLCHSYFLVPCYNRCSLFSAGASSVLIWSRWQVP